MFGGANDIFYNLGAFQRARSRRRSCRPTSGTAAVQLVQQVGTLQAAGARYVMVWNLPDIGKTPDGTASGQAAAISQITGLFNSTLSQGLDALGGNVIRLNTLAFFNEVLANPAAFGLTNVTSRACGATPSLLCTSANFVTPTAPLTYLFADGVHPTTAGHADSPQYAESLIEGPAKMAMLAEAPLAVEEANFRALDGRMQSGLGAPRANNKFDAWVVYDYANPDYTGSFLNGNADVNTISVGGDMKMSDELLVGGQFGYSENKGDFGNGTGGYKLKEAMGTIYMGCGEAPGASGFTAYGGDLDFSDVHRNIKIGST